MDNKDKTKTKKEIEFVVKILGEYSDDELEKMPSFLEIVERIEQGFTKRGLEAQVDIMPLSKCEK